MFYVFNTKTFSEISQLFPTTARMTSSSSSSLSPRVLVFDLDGCVWEPEMYELWGRGGSPFKEWLPHLGPISTLIRALLSLLILNS
jgi:hypothetical protein